MAIQAGGLASGLDTASIIDSLVSLQKAPITQIEDRMKAVKVRVSALGTLASQVKALGTALDDLSSKGVRAASVTSKNTSFTATTATGAVPGRFSVQIDQLAAAAKARSGLLPSETAPVRGSTLAFSIDGTTTNIEIADGTPLNEVADQLNAAGLPITAAVLFDGQNGVLSLSRTTTGHTVGSDPSTALSITETVTGTTGTALGLTTTAAKNTVAQIDGLRFERKTTSIIGGVPGVTIEANTEGGAAETLSVAEDSAKTKERLKTFVDAYNAIAKNIQSELDITADTDRGKTLAGDTTLRLLQGQLQRTLTTSLGSGGLQTLADIGLKTGRDGSLSLDDSTLTKALSRDGSGVDRLFAKTGAIGVAINNIVTGFTGTDGILPQRTSSYSAETRRLEDDKAKKEARLETFRAQLVSQFTAMEKIVSSMNSTSSYLTNAFAKNTSSS
jgi:flagellar hook-associated protein 2